LYEKTKINEKEARVGPFKKNQAIVQALSASYNLTPNFISAKGQFLSCVYAIDMFVQQLSHEHLEAKCEGHCTFF